MSLINDIFSGVERALFNGITSVIAEGLNAKSIGNEYQPGDVELVDIVLLSEDQQRTYSLISQAVTVDIFESIMSPVMWCEMTISDSMGLLQNFPIIGEEYVKIVYKTPKLKGKRSEYLFRVNAVTNKRVTENNKKITYTLQCCSAEMITNVKTFVDMNDTDTCKNLVEKVMEDFIKTEKPLHIEETVGIEKILMNRVTPFSMIDYLRQRAVSNRFQSSSYCFFESRRGFTFATLEGLMEEGAKRVESGNHDKVFFYDTARNDSFENVTIRNILAYNQIQFADTISKINHGALNNAVQNFDLITGDVQKITYTDNLGADQFKSSSSTSSSGQSTSFTRHHGKTSTIAKLVTTRSDKSLTNHPEKLSKAQAYAQKLSQNITQIHIYGDSTIQVGDVIECRFPSGVDTSKDRGVSRLDSGTYFVAKVRHMILNGERPQYTQALELIKTDLQEAAA